MAGGPAVDIDHDVDVVGRDALGGRPVGQRADRDHAIEGRLEPAAMRIGRRRREVMRHDLEARAVMRFDHAGQQDPTGVVVEVAREIAHAQSVSRRTNRRAAGSFAGDALRDLPRRALRRRQLLQCGRTGQHRQRTGADPVDVEAARGAAARLLLYLRREAPGAGLPRRLDHRQRLCRVGVDAMNAPVDLDRVAAAAALIEREGGEIEQRDPLRRCRRVDLADQIARGDGCGERFLIAPIRGQQQREVDERARIPCIQRDRAPEMRFGAGRIALQPQQQPEIVMQFGRLRIGRDRIAKLLLAPFALLARKIGIDREQRARSPSALPGRDRAPSAPKRAPRAKEPHGDRSRALAAGLPRQP